jgi:tRNA(fMet)-specific endonuclease VapC
MGIVIDTSALVAAERLATTGATGAGTWASVLNAIGDQPAALPAIVYAELLAGVELADSPRRAAARRARIDALTAHVALIDFDAEIARAWARLFAHASRAGLSVPANNLAVAATAVYLEYAVLVGTLNDKHFRAIEGLTVETLPA